MLCFRAGVYFFVLLLLLSKAQNKHPLAQLYSFIIIINVWLTCKHWELPALGFAFYVDSGDPNSSLVHQVPYGVSYPCSLISDTVLMKPVAHAFLI